MELILIASIAIIILTITLVALKIMEKNNILEEDPHTWMYEEDINRKI